jgi:hypothetical protein
MSSARGTIRWKLRAIISFTLAVAIALTWQVAQTASPDVKPQGAKFNECLAGLRTADLVDPGVDLILRELSRTPEFQGTKWNINHPYEPDAINVLVPQGNTIWPSVCNLIAEPAGCETSPAEGYIICNPPIGTQLSSPLVRSGIANLETNFAKRFILMTFIGHELGHLSFHSEGTRYLEPRMLKWMQPYGMTCDQTKTGGEPTEEERADVYGLEKACEALHLDPDFGLVPTAPGEVVSVLQRLQDDLDDTYFMTDDACVREDSYPSISRRKHTFLRAYLKCLYPKGWNPVADVAEEDASSLERLETWLRDRQISGFVASGSYAKATLYSHQIAKGNNSYYITYDSTGIDSALWYVAPPINGLITKQLVSWPSTGQTIWVQEGLGELAYYVLLNHSGRLDNSAVVEVRVKCDDGAPVACNTNVRNRELDKGLTVVRGTDGTVIVHGGRHVEYYRSFDKFFESAAEWSKKIGDLPMDPEQTVVAAENKQTAMVIKSDAGFYSTIVVKDGDISRRALFAFPKETGTIEAAAFVKGRLLLSIYDKPLAGGGRLNLWDCPSTVLDTIGKTISRTCHVYTAPNETKSSVAMATRDLSSLFVRSVTIAPQSCGALLVIRYRGWLWLLDRAQNRQDILPADGVIGCDQSDNSVETYRARRVDHLSLKLGATTSRDSELTSLPQLQPK